MKPFEGTVLVAGATGRTGQWIVRSLQARNLNYRLFVRSGTKAIELFGPEVIDRLIIGSIENDREVDAAVRHCTGVISAIGSYVTDPEAPTPAVIDRDGLIRLATAARRHGVKKIVVVSSLSVTKPEHPLNKYGQVLTMKLEGENVVRELFSEPGLSYTVLRPGGLLDGPPLQHVLKFDTGDRITGAINRSDVAEVAVLSLTHPKAHNLTFELIGTADAPQNSLEPFFDQL